MRRAPALTIFVLAALPGCIPSRDNPYDPQNRPVAGLSVYVGAPGGPNQGSRQAVFVLDASASVDPSDRGQLTFEWDRDGLPGFELPSEADPLLPCASPDSIGPCTLDCGGQPDACLRTRLAGEPGARLLGVRATTGHGNYHDDAIATASLTNAAPVVELGEDLFVPDLTGGVVHLDACSGRQPCTSYDPDGDPLTWEFLPLQGEFEVFLAASNDTSRQFIAPSAEQSLLFEVVADDGIAQTRDRVRVHVGTQVWLTSFDPSVVYRIYADFRIGHVYTPGLVVGTGALPFSVSGGLAVDDAVEQNLKVWVGTGVVDSNNQLSQANVELFGRSDDGDLNSIDSWNRAGGYLPSSVATAGIGACAAFRTGFAIPLPGFFARMTPGAALIEGDGEVALGAEPRFVHRLDGTDCWAITGPSPLTPAAAASVYRLHPDGTTTGVALDVLDDIMASVVTSSGELWIAGPDSQCAGSRIRRISPLGAVTDVACHSHALDALAAHPDAGAWGHDSETNDLWLFTATSAALTNAPQLGLPPLDNGAFPRGEPAMTTDPRARDLWIVDSYQRRLGRLAEKDGEFADVTFAEADSIRFSTFGSSPRFGAIAISSVLGRAVVAMPEAGFGVALVFAPHHLRVTERLFLSSPFATVSPEPTRGEAWFADNGSTLDSLRKLTPRGAVQLSVPSGDAYWSQAQTDGGTWAAVGTETGGGRLIRVTPDGDISLEWPYPPLPMVQVSGFDEQGFVCGLATDFATDNVIVYLDLATMTPTIEATAYDNLTARPIRAAPTGCWFSFLDGRMVFLDASGVPQEIDQSGDPFTSAFQLDVDWDGTAWFVGGDPTTSELRAFSGDPGGPATRELDLFPFGINAVNVQRRCIPGTCSDAKPLQVWVAQGTQVLRLDEEGRILQSFGLPFIGNINGLEVLP